MNLLGDFRRQTIGQTFHVYLGSVIVINIIILSPYPWPVEFVHSLITAQAVSILPIGALTWMPATRSRTRATDSRAI